MGIRSLILFVQLLVAAGEETPPASGQALVFFARPEKRLVDEPRLLDAVSIYTRDLGLAVLPSGEMQPPNPTIAPTDDLVAFLRARGARIGFWYQVAPDDRSIDLMTVDVRKQVTRQTFVLEGAPDANLYRAMALKLRVLVAGRDSPSAVASGAPAAAAAGPPSGANVASTAPSAGLPGSARTPASSDQVGLEKGASPLGGAVAAEPSRSSRPVFSPDSRRLFGAAGYALSVPSGSASWRHAVALHGVVRFRARGEGDFGLEIAPSQARSGATGTVSVLDVPVRLGLRAVGPGRLRFVTVGVVVGAHLLFARGDAVAPETAVDRTFTVAASGGFELVARTGSTHGLAPEFRAWIEVNVPRTRFLAREAPRFEAGSVNAGVSLGVAFPAP